MTGGRIQQTTRDVVVQTIKLGGDSAAFRQVERLAQCADDRQHPGARGAALEKVSAGSRLVRLPQADEGAVVKHDHEFQRRAGLGLHLLIRLNSTGLGEHGFSWFRTVYQNSRYWLPSCDRDDD